MAYPTLLILTSATSNAESVLAAVSNSQKIKCHIFLRVQHEPPNNPTRASKWDICQCKAIIICHSRSDCCTITLSAVLYFSVEQSVLFYTRIIILRRTRPIYNSSLNHFLCIWLQITEIPNSNLLEKWGNLLSCVRSLELGWAPSDIINGLVMPKEAQVLYASPLRHC